MKPNKVFYVGRPEACITVGGPWSRHDGLKAVYRGGYGGLPTAVACMVDGRWVGVDGGDATIVADFLATGQAVIPDHVVDAADRLYAVAVAAPRPPREVSGIEAATARAREDRNAADHRSNPTPDHRVEKYS